MSEITDFIPFANSAIQEMGFSGLPGRVNGPADAYRHMLWAADLTASLANAGLSDFQAAAIARAALALHEINASPDSYGEEKRGHSTFLGSLTN